MKLLPTAVLFTAVQQVQVFWDCCSSVWLVFLSSFSSKEAFSKNLQLWHSILLQGNLLPTSYQEANRVIKQYLIPEFVFDICANDCIVFRGDKVTCPKCNHSRFRTGNIPKQTFHFLPLGPWLVRIFGIKDIFCIIHCHGGNNNIRKWRQMSDIHDSQKMKKAFSACCTFKGDPCGIGLLMCLDGLKPWSKNKSNYSMWPTALGQLNLPRSIRYNFANLIPVAIIPSQVLGKEPKYLYLFLEVLVDEILFLSRCKIYDTNQHAPFHATVEVVIYRIYSNKRPTSN